MIRTIRTNSTHPDFIHLVKHLDADLAIRDGDEHAFYSQFNTIDNIKYAIVAYHHDEPVGCGAIKEFNLDTAEVKRITPHQKPEEKELPLKFYQSLKCGQRS